MSWNNVFHATVLPAALISSAKWRIMNKATDMELIGLKMSVCYCADPTYPYCFTVYVHLCPELCMMTGKYSFNKKQKHNYSYIWRLLKLLLTDTFWCHSKTIKVMWVTLIINLMLASLAIMWPMIIKALFLISSRFNTHTLLQRKTH